VISCGGFPQVIVLKTGGLASGRTASPDGRKEVVRTFCLSHDRITHFFERFTGAIWQIATKVSVNRNFRKKIVHLILRES
jgi:hypothetical protein